MKSFKYVRFALLFVGISMLPGCGPTTVLTRTWTDPSVKAETFKPFTKILVICRVKDETGSRIAEDKLVAQIKNGVGIPSYSYLHASDTVQKDVDARLKKDGFDGLLIMRLVDVATDVSVYNSGGYYRYGYGGNTSVYVDKNYMVETNIYSLITGKLLWSGTTSSMNPSSLETTLDEIIAADKAQLVKQGLIKP